MAVSISKLVTLAQLQVQAERIKQELAKYTLTSELGSLAEKSEISEDELSAALKSVINGKIDAADTMTTDAINDAIQDALKNFDGGSGSTTANLTIGTVTSGETASATIVGGKLNLVLPKGDPGPAGAQGETGPQGPGITDTAKKLMLSLFENAAYSGGEMQSTLDALRTEWGAAGGTTTVPVASVTLDKTTLSLTVENTATLTATVLPINATNRTVTWSVSPAGYATVSGGKVTAVAAGSCTVTAAAGGKTATCAVTVADKSQTPTTDKYGTLLYKLSEAESLDGRSYLDTHVKLFADSAAADWTVIAAYTGPVSCAQGLPNNLFCCCYDGGQGLLCRQAAKNEGWIVAGGRGAFLFNDSCFSSSGKTYAEIIREDGKVNVVSVTKEGNNFAFYLNGVMAWNSPLEYGFDATIPEKLSLIFGARYSADGKSIEYKTAFTLNDARVYDKALSKTEVVEISETLIGG